MSLREEMKYEVFGRYGLQKMTAKELYNRVMEDSKSDYNWIASAPVLVTLCKEPTFPEEYAQGIKIAILNCFANIEHRANSCGDRYRSKVSDKAAVEECYNSLYGVESEKAISARKRFLSEMISTASYVRLFDSLYHPGPTFKKLCVDWRKAKFEDWISKRNINFEKLIEVLRISFTAMIKEAELKGDFIEDEKKDAEEMKEFYRKIGDNLL
ncbi:MAG: hypothetical protein IKT41_04855 [Clostridia bacterium]|nr:hypothetical protein [Clostridia bacterium]